MTISEYEKHLIGELCWNCHAPSRGSFEQQRQCPSCRRKWSYQLRRQQWNLLFVLQASAHHAAKVVGVSSAYQAFANFRSTLAQLAQTEASRLFGEIELDESYFGGHRKGQRGRGAAGKVAVFGLLERHGKVCAVVAPNCGKETLMSKIRTYAVKGAVFYTDKLPRLGKLRQTSAGQSSNHLCTRHLPH